ncbi:hypothetical protein BaRGS_00036993, partial [Batillaria attramentaria]
TGQEEGTCQVMITDTPPGYAYEPVCPGFSWSNHTSLTFVVLTCDGPHVLLSAGATDLDPVVYEIVLGLDGQSLIRTEKQSPSRVAVKSHGANITNCDDVAAFYVSWSEGLLQVGKAVETSWGFRWMSPFLTYQGNETFVVNSVHVSAFTNRAVWGF